MYKRYYKKNKEEDEGEVERIIFSITGLVLLYMVFVYYVDKKQFWIDMNHYIFPSLAIIFLGVICYIFYLRKRQEKYGNNFKQTIKEIKDSGFEESVKNFIERFGKEGNPKTSWLYRDYKFDWKTLEDFKETAINNKVNIKKENFSELVLILKYYIDENAKNYLNKRIETKVSNNIDELSKNGDDFENLIVRLYSAM